ncbi:biopolymer transport protein ExbD [Hydrocarboniphaga daqingensis]|jgi:biopolymer transport protein ExbD|uniref:Biopolymer transport protein ExbD n=1 Tax=Hydrocarboniphaga daqingensis TaxID=490188 RepID=A0A1M5PCP1_9GAMM|nr:biopolymer transporter ExbD [Hydrocarboniphaga daqingensis]SHG99564.1 biopolymer transport protein ExbD [Hydrocarboniphaga daqingensis]
MKFRRHTVVQEDTGIDLAPMLDFVMNLLIFFIIAAAFVHESGIRVNRPAAKTAKPEDKGSIFVAVSATNEVWIDRQRVDIRRLRAEIERMRRDRPKAAVVVQADRDARAGLMVEVMDQARLAGVADVAISATPQ